jgi:hypothetical protein
VVGHFREIPDAHSALLLSVALDKGGEPVDKSLGLFLMREMAGAADQFQPRSRDRLTPALAEAG